MQINVSVTELSTQDNFQSTIIDGSKGFIRFQENIQQNEIVLCTNSDLNTLIEQPH